VERPASDHARPGRLIDKGTKGERARLVPIIGEIRPLVQKRLDVISEDPMARLFTGRGGRISTAVLRDATHWDEVVSDLGYIYLRRHDLRHTGLTWMADAGVPVHVLRKIAGHGSARRPRDTCTRTSNRSSVRARHLAPTSGPSRVWSPDGPTAFEKWSGWPDLIPYGSWLVNRTAMTRW
jgi:integrase